MGLIDEIKVLVGKFMKSPFKTGIAAYLIWRILKPQSETVALFEGIKVLHSDEGKELVQDTATDYYGVIKGTTVSYFKDLDEAEQFYNEGVKMKKLERLHKEMIHKEISSQAITRMDGIVNQSHVRALISAENDIMKDLTSDGFSISEALEYVIHIAKRGR